MKGGFVHAQQSEPCFTPIGHVPTRPCAKIKLVCKDDIDLSGMDHPIELAPGEQAPFDPFLGTVVEKPSAE